MRNSPNMPLLETVHFGFPSVPLAARKPRNLALAALALIGVLWSFGARAMPTCGDPSAACFIGDRGSPTTYPKPAAADQPLKLHHISLYSNNQDRLAEWYRDMLGFTIAGRFTVRRPDGVEINIVRLTMDGLWLNISHLPGIADRDRRVEYAGWRHVAFGTGDAQRAWESLKARGAEVVGNGRVTFEAQGYAVAFARDPDGNFIEFYQDIRPPAF